MQITVSSKNTDSVFLETAPANLQLEMSVKK